MKADTTFEGLKQLTIEFDERVWIGDIPNQIQTTRAKPTRFIDSVKIDKIAGSDLQETWFHQTLELNPGLVAIIGNRGSGKSALADTVGLLGQTRHSDKFSFLTDTKFCQPKQNKGRHFTATMRWLSSGTNTAQLDAEVQPGQVELVKYIPQNFLELICNEIGRPEESEFDRELKAVIFSHVPEAERLGKTSLDDLIGFKSQETYTSLGHLVGALHELNKKICDLEESTLEENRQRLDNALKARQADLLAHAGNKPSEVLPPDLGDANNIQLNEKATVLDAQLVKLTEEKHGADDTLAAVTLKSSLLTKVADRVANAKQQLEAIVAALRSDATALGLTAEQLISVTFHAEPLAQLRTELDAQLVQAKQKVAELDASIKAANEELTSTRAAMAGPAKDYQAYLAATKKWQDEQNQIIGDDHTHGTIKALDAERKRLDTVPEQVASLQRSRLDSVRAIFSKINGLAKAYQDLYKPVQEFISQHPIVKDKIHLDFDASIIDVGFKDKFLELINQGSSGSFSGKDEGNRALKSLLDAVDWSDEDQVVSFVSSMFDHLTHDLRASKRDKEGESPKSVELRSQLRKGKTPLELYDLVCGLTYLRPRYSLRVRDRELHEMSPGERGILLLIFYLLIDSGDTPLLIDQPEENLDNQTIYNLLVPAIREAKKRRQIIIVTHNPNLAVVCDADQVIAASIDKSNSNTITYLCGALENPAINRKVLDILEGTQPAFKNRDSKYQFSHA